VKIAMPPSPAMNEAIELIRQLGRDRFYGALTLKFEAGRIVIINKNETLKPSELPGQPGKRKDETNHQ
jgi:hypothetical protein